MHDKRVAGAATDAYESYSYRVMRSMTDDVAVAEDDAAAEADAARDEREVDERAPRSS